MNRKIFSLIFSSLVFVLAACGGGSESAESLETSPITQTAHNTQTRQALTQTLTLFPTQTKTLAPSMTATPAAPTFVREGTPPPQPIEPITDENAHKIVELARWGYGAIKWIEHSPDGRFMFIQTSMGVYTYHAGTLDEFWRFEVDEGVSAMAISPDNQKVAIGTYTGEIIFINLEDGQEIYAWKGHTAEVMELAFSSDMTMLVSGSRDKSMMLWQVESELMIKLMYKKESNCTVYHAYFVDDDRMIMAHLDLNYKYKLLDVESGEIVRVFNNNINAVSTEYDIYVADGKIRRLSDNELLAEIKFDELDGKRLFASSYAFSVNGQILAVGGSVGFVGTVTLWDVEDGSLISVFETEAMYTFSKGHLAKPALRSGPGPIEIISLDFSPGDRYLVATNWLGNIYVWDLKSGVMKTIIESENYKTFFSYSGDQLISFSKDALAVYDTSTGERLEGISEGWSGYSTELEYDEKMSFSPDSTHLAIGSRLWIIEEGKRLELPAGEKALTFSESGEYIYALRRQWWVVKRSVDGLELFEQVQLERPEKSYEVFWSNGDRSWWELGGWRISPDGTTIRAGGYITPSLVWSGETGEFIRFVSIKGNLAHCFEFSFDGHYLTDQRYHGVVEVLAVSERQSDGTYEHLYDIEIEGDMEDFIFSLDNQIVISTNQSVESYDPEKGVHIDSFRLPGYFGTKIAVSPDGSLLAISDGKEISIRDLNEDIILTKFQGHFEETLYIAFSPNGRYLATSSSDGTVRLWGIPP